MSKGCPRKRCPVQKVLVVDDEAGIRDIIRRGLQHLGVQVWEAANGQEALSLVTRQAPDLILLDLGLPDTPGVDLVRPIRQLVSAPVVILSASWPLQYIAGHEPVSGYLSNPFKISSLIDIVRAHLSLP